jgi:hypothetical protein
MRFERKILRKIYGPTKFMDGTSRIKTNEELDNLIEHKNIIHFIKAQRLVIVIGHVERINEDRHVRKLITSIPGAFANLRAHHFRHSKQNKKCLLLSFKYISLKLLTCEFHPNKFNITR